MAHLERVTVCTTNQIIADYSGQHVLLSVEEYNALVRQINCMKMLLSELLTPSQKKSTFYESLHQNNNQTIATR